MILSKEAVSAIADRNYPGVARLGVSHEELRLVVDELMIALRSINSHQNCDDSFKIAHEALIEANKILGEK
jgi:hypothetical protein